MSEDLAGIRVVLIDDSNTIRRSGEIFLTQAGCKVVLAEDGFDGLSKVVDTKPDIIFVDVMMPRLDGYQTCALIKSHNEFKNTPVVMLTSKDSLFDRAVKAGAKATMPVANQFWGDRCGRAHSNQIDWRIVALDGLGLLLFFIPGVMTPSDIELALRLGCRLLKFFPADAAGGVKMLKALAETSGDFAESELSLFSTETLTLVKALAEARIEGRYAEADWQRS